MQNKKRGGKRDGAGRKKSSIKTKTISFRVDVRYIKAIEAVAKAKIAQLKAASKQVDFEQPKQFLL